MEEIKPVVMAKYELRYREKGTLLAIFGTFGIIRL